MLSLRVAWRKETAGSFSFFAGRQVLWAGRGKVSQTPQLPLLSIFTMAVRVGGGRGYLATLGNTPTPRASGSSSEAEVIGKSSASACGSYRDLPELTEIVPNGVSAPIPLGTPWALGTCV